MEPKASDPHHLLLEVGLAHEGLGDDHQLYIVLRGE